MKLRGRFFLQIALAFNVEDSNVNWECLFEPVATASGSDFVDPR